MACVTLKRPLDIDPLDSLHSLNRQPPKRRRCTPLKNADRDCNIEDPSNSSKAEQSVFQESPLSTTEIAGHLRDKLKRLRKRRQLVSEPCSSLEFAEEPIMSEAIEVARSLSLVPTSQCRSPPRQAGISASMMAASPSSSKADRPVFTLNQMTMICEKMCQERTDKVREEYNRILQQKLSEQYDAFVKFIDHQIQQRFNQSQLPSYLS